MLTVGTKLPAFSLQACVSTENGREFAEITDRSHEGKWRVLFFWPLDFTFVCPTEIEEFGNTHAEFQQRGAVVLGASIDSPYVHLAWRNTDSRLCHIPYPMLADVKRDLSRALGVLHEQEGVAIRATFIIDPEGVIRFASAYDLSTGRNVREVLRTLDALQTGERCPVNWEKGQKTL